MPVEFALGSQCECITIALKAFDAVKCYTIRTNWVEFGNT